MAREYLEFSYSDEANTILDVREDPLDAPGEVSFRLEDAQYHSLSAWIDRAAVQTLYTALGRWLARQEEATR